MNSSTGFKKRSLLRPMSGVRRQEKQYLRSFDISQSESMISSQIKSQIIKIQQEISRLDKDKKIRTGDSTLEKSYFSTLKKWLKEAMNGGQKQDDDGKIIKYLGVDSYQAGFKKMWKILMSMDQMITKVTQLEIIQLLRYDQAFFQLCGEDSQLSTSMLQTLSKTGFNPGTFQISQVLHQRSKDIYERAMESKKKGGNNLSFVTATNNESSNSRKSQTNQLIKQLQKQNAKLVSLMEELEKEKEKSEQMFKNQQKKEDELKKSIKENQNLANTNTASKTQSGDVNNIFRQFQEKYNEKIGSMSTKIHILQGQISELKISLSTSQSKLKMAEQDIQQKSAIGGQKPKSGSYEEALIEQMDKMKKGFEKKIQRLLEEFGFKEKEMRKKEIEYRTDNQKIKWEKNLLLKKFDSLQQQAAK